MWKVSDWKLILIGQVFIYGIEVVKIWKVELFLLVINKVRFSIDINQSIYEVLFHAVIRISIATCCIFQQRVLDKSIKDVTWVCQIINAHFFKKYENFKFRFFLKQLWGHINTNFKTVRLHLELIFDLESGSLLSFKQICESFSRLYLKRFCERGLLLLHKVMACLFLIERAIVVKRLNCILVAFLPNYFSISYVNLSKNKVNSKARPLKFIFNCLAICIWQIAAIRFDFKFWVVFCLKKVIQTWIVDLEEWTSLVREVLLVFFK